jgi:hypothetical protein
LGEGGFVEVGVFTAAAVTTSLGSIRAKATDEHVTKNRVAIVLSIFQPIVQLVCV